PGALDRLRYRLADNVKQRIGHFSGGLDRRHDAVLHGLDQTSALLSCHRSPPVLVSEHDGAFSRHVKRFSVVRANARTLNCKSHASIARRGTYLTLMRDFPDGSGARSHDSLQSAAMKTLAVPLIAFAVSVTMA